MASSNTPASASLTPGVLLYRFGFEFHRLCLTRRCHHPQPLLTTLEHVSSLPTLPTAPVSVVKGKKNGTAVNWGTIADNIHLCSPQKTHTAVCLPGWICRRAKRAQDKEREKERAAPVPMHPTSAPRPTRHNFGAVHDVGPRMPLGGGTLDCLVLPKIKTNSVHHFDRSNNT